MKSNCKFHKYQRMEWPSGKPFYKCMEANCTHYLPLAMLVIGRESLCWGDDCNRLVTITREDVNNKLKRPMCEQCRKKRLERRNTFKEIT